jgi:ABC-2 type transport system permease protein
MDKVWLVIRREYLARVQKKSFLVATLLTPLIFPAIMGVFLWISLSDSDKDALRIIEVVDENNLFFLESSDQYAFSFSAVDQEEGKRMVRDGERFGFLYIPKLDLAQPSGITYFGEKNANLGLVTLLESSLKKRIEEQRLFQSGISTEVIEAYRTTVSIKSITLDASGEEKITDATVNYAIGFLAGILIYVFIFIYGNQIMQGVIEEKSSRIIEILVSSVRPFQLMLGKIIGIGAVGLTQFLIWVILIGGISSILGGYFEIKMPQQQMMDMGNAGMGQIAEEQNNAMDLILVIQGIDFVQLVLTFTFYFLAGYLFYGAFFAAVGAAVDAPSEAQQFMFPVTVPLLIGYMGLFIFVLNDPNSQTSFWLSIIPFTSPIGMMGRVSYGVPTWELLLSMVLLIGGFFASTWMAAKIYRIGILVHGTKVEYKTLWRWLKSSH